MSVLGTNNQVQPTYMSNIEPNSLISDPVVLIKALISSKRLLISANSEVCVADECVQDD